MYLSHPLLPRSLRPFVGTEYWDRNRKYYYSSVEKNCRSLSFSLALFLYFSLLPSRLVFFSSFFSFFSSSCVLFRIEYEPTNTGLKLLLLSLPLSLALSFTLSLLPSNWIASFFFCLSLSLFVSFICFWAYSFCLSLCL